MKQREVWISTIPDLPTLWLNKILKTENCPYEASVNLVLTDNEEIKKVNAEFRNIFAPTDVLSFPMIPFETPADYSVIEDQDEYFDLDTDELLLGDVIIYL